MAITDLPAVGLHHISEAVGLTAHKGAAYVATLTGALVLTDQYPNILKLDPGGSARDITLDPVATSEGLTRWIVNAADTTENLVLKNVGGDTIATVNQNESAFVYCDGATWTLIAIVAIALS